MNRFIKTVLLTILAAICCVCAFACTTTPDGTTNKKGLLYKKYGNDAFYTVYGYVDDGRTSTVLDIANEVENGVVIGRIKENAFADNNTLTEIIVPDTVTKIDEGAFAKMKKLQSLTVPFIGGTAKADSYFGETGSAEDKSVDLARTFGYWFGTEVYQGGTEITQLYNKNDSTTVYVPVTLTTVKIAPKDNYKIPMYAFSGNTVIQKLVLTEKITAIGDYACNQMVALETIAIPNTVTRIGAHAFEKCVNLKEASGEKGISFASGCTLETIGEYAFTTTGLVNFTVPASVNTIGKYAFAGSTLESINLSNVQVIEEGTFTTCKHLTTVNASNVSVIKGFAFIECYSLASYDLTGVTELGAWSFKDTAEGFTFTNAGSLDTNAALGIA